jgi:hypothetical protein
LEGEGRPLPLLLDSYVRAEIDAGMLENVLVIPRAALREGGRLWLVDANNELRIRATEVLWTKEGASDALVVSNVIEPGEQLVISGLRTALPGMKVNPQPDAPATTSGPSPADSAAPAAPSPGQPVAKPRISTSG